MDYSSSDKRAYLLQVNIPDVAVQLGWHCCFLFSVINSVFVLWNHCGTYMCLTSSLKCKCCHWKRSSTGMQEVQQHFQRLPLWCLLIRTAPVQRWLTRQLLQSLAKSKQSLNSQMFPGTELQQGLCEQYNSSSSVVSLFQDKCVSEKSCFILRFFTITPLNDLNYFPT